LEPKLVVAYIGQDVQDFLPLSLDSIKDVADAIVFVDGGSKDKTLNILNDYGFETNGGFKTFINRRYEHEHIGANGRARNAYLQFIQKHYPDYWCLVIDPDEVVQEPERIKPTIELLEKEYKEDVQIYSPKMRHLIGNLTTEDTHVPKHYCPGRFFRVHQSLYYEEVEHPVIGSKTPCRHMYLETFTLWHLAYAKEMFAIKKRYDNHMAKSNMHTPEFLRQWYKAHIFGTYPSSKFHPSELPNTVKKFFDINDDELYFENRGVENKHWFESLQWIKHFNLIYELNNTVLFCGDGLGVRTFTMRSMGIPACGFDISKYAVEHNVGGYGNTIYWQEDITKFQEHKRHGLVVCYDVLEHIDEKDIDQTLDNVSKYGKNFVFSIPFIGDPNLENDSTHKIKWTRQQWIDKIQQYGIKIVETPNHWLFKEQILVGEKNGKT